MADTVKQIKEFGQLPDFGDEDLLLCQSYGTTYNVMGLAIKQYAIAAAKVQADAAAAAKAAAEAAEEAAEEQAQAALEKAAEALRSASEAAASAADALTHRQAAEAAKTAAEGHATTARSWAEGGTGTREGEATNNAKYWAGFAQSQAESVTVPAAEGVYNVVLQDRAVEGDRYALIVENGVLKLLGVKNTVDAATPTLIDNTSGVSWKLAVENGRLLIEEV